jgi:hypothetical protein
MVRLCSFLSCDTMTSLAHSLNSWSSPVGLRPVVCRGSLREVSMAAIPFFSQHPRKRKQQKPNSVLVSCVAMTLRRNNIGRCALDEAEESRQ